MCTPEALLRAVVERDGHPEPYGVLTEHLDAFDGEAERTPLEDAFLLLASSSVACLAGRSEEARAGALRARPHFHGLTDPCALVDLIVGITHVDQAELGRAIVVLGDAIPAYQPHVGDDPHRLCVLGEMELYYGLAHRRLGFRDVALETNLRGLALLADVDLRDARLLRSMYHNNVAVILRMEGDHDESRAHLERAIAIGDQEGLVNSRVAQRLNLVRALTRTGEHEAAGRWLDEAASIATTRRQQADVDQARARIALTEGRAAEAVGLLEPVLAIRRDEGRSTMLVRTLALLGQALVAAQDPRARAILEEGMALAREQGDLEQQEGLAEALRDEARQRDDPATALDHSETILRIVRQRADDQRSFQLQQIRARHELEEHLHREELLRVRTVELEAAVARRTAELMTRNAALQEAQDAARAAALAKSRFLAVTSHELRTPLNAVLGYTEMLQEELEDGVQPEAESLEQIHRAAQHMLDLVQRVLSLASLESGLEQPVCAPFDAAATLDDVLGSAASWAERRGHTMTVTVPRPLPVHTDEARLRRVVRQLVDNAIDHNEPTSIDVVVALEGEELVVEVSNAGRPFDVAELEELFAPFTQADMTYTRRRGGLGLGLALARQEVQLLGGRIVGAPREGGGLIVRVAVPITPG